MTPPLRARNPASLGALGARALAAALEEGALSGPLAAWLGRAYGALARPCRPLELPPGIASVGVGSATLGGAGKTPLAVAIARALAASGRRAGLVGHAYRARPGRARLVSPGDRVGEVGDDALFAARALEGSGALVTVAPTREAAASLAASLGADVLVFDGLLQASPRRLDLALLAVDAERPFGAGACPPAGDLRAPLSALAEAADALVLLGRRDRSGPRIDAALAAAGLDPEALPAFSLESGATSVASPSGERLALADLALRPVGLLVAVAHPERLLADLSRAGVRPRARIALADHASFPPALLARAARLDVSAWLTTARCATKLPARLGRAPVLALEHAVDVSPLALLLARLPGWSSGAQPADPLC